MSDLTATANLLLRNFLGQVVPPLREAKIELVTDAQLSEESKGTFSCSAVLNQGEKKLPSEKIYVLFSNFPMIKFFGRTWTEFQGQSGITPIVASIQDHFRYLKPPPETGIENTRSGNAGPARKSTKS